MIYLPNHFAEKDETRSLQLIRDYPFATLVSIHDGAPVFNHLPLIPRDIGAGKIVLLGHMACRNPQSMSLAEGEQVTAIFHGPHTYITPTWYIDCDVPTWNYAVVHVTGKMRWIREFRPLIALLREMTDVFEGNRDDRWRFTLPDDLKSEEELTSAIIGFEIQIESIQAKFKLSQNRSPEDYAGVIRGLEARTDEMSRKVLEMMR